MHFFKRLFAVLLTAIMLSGALPMAAMAELELNSSSNTDLHDCHEVQFEADDSNSTCILYRSESSMQDKIINYANKWKEKYLANFPQDNVSDTLYTGGWCCWFTTFCGNEVGLGGTASNLTFIA